MDIAIKAAITGHLLLSTLHTNDAIQTIIRLTNMGVPNFMIAGALNTIVAQRLARKICQSCKQEDTSITKEQLKDIGFSLTEVETLKIYKGKGCSKCNDTGYKGPKHIAIIMDGNGRWAKKKGLLRSIGHENGTKSVRTIVEACVELGVENLTLYAFSTENWNRPKIEVKTLMGLLIFSLKKEMQTMQENSIEIEEDVSNDMI